MELIETGIAGLVEIRPRRFGDERGWFTETYSEQRYREVLGLAHPFVQDNLSCSAKGVLRGLHFQAPPMAQSKLVMVLRGQALDVAVDIRKDSPTYGAHRSVILDAALGNQFFVPRGFAHGFVALEDDTLFAYKCDNTYSPEHEGALLWNSPELGIDWQLDAPNISPKDAVAPLFADFVSPF